MKKNGLLETITTKYIVLTITIILILVPVSLFKIIDTKLTNLENLATFVDATIKVIALLVGAIWVLNRIYITREESSHIGVDADITCVPSKRFQDSGYSLLVYRIDIINKGKILIEPFQHFIEIHSIDINKGEIIYTKIYRWPENGVHESGPIEPNSWSAVNDAIAIPNNVQAIRVFVHVKLRKEGNWTWHKTFDIKNETGINNRLLH